MTIGDEGPHCSTIANLLGAEVIHDKKRRFVIYSERALCSKALKRLW